MDGSQSILRTVSLLPMALALTSCASPGDLIDTPQVELTGIQMNDFSFSGQSFLLSFDVDNPNPFPLPVSSIRYHVQIANENFASGQTASDFTVPANGDGAFDISVNLDMMKSASQLASILRTGMREPLEYKLNGSLDVDIPYVKPVPFSASGVITIASR